jgi:hypothetical protein
MKQAFKLKNVKGIKSIFDEYVVGLIEDQFIDILKYVYRSPFDFFIYQYGPTLG